MGASKAAKLAAKITGIDKKLIQNVEFFDEYNNVSAIYFNINSKGTNYDIRWINKKI